MPFPVGDASNSLSASLRSDWFSTFASSGKDEALN